MNKMLGLIEAAEILGYSPDKLRKIVQRTRHLNRQGRPDPLGIKFSQRGQGRIMFKIEWLDEYVERHAIDPLSPSHNGRNAKPVQKLNQAVPIKSKQSQSSNHGNNW